MRKFYLLSTLVLTMLLGGTSYAQDFSNKGKDFWVAYGYHQQMLNINPPGGQPGGTQQMVLYFATDQVTNITINIPALGYTQTLTSPAGNNVLTSAVIPKTGAQDARLLTEGLSNKGIHITSDKAMVAYAHIYNQSVSGATILFPTNTLGKEYYSVNYKNWSNNNNSNCWFYVVAADTGTTKVEITPTGNTTGGWVAGTTYIISLTQGQVYNVMGSLISSPAGCNPVCTGYDLTGSKIQSVGSASGGCKKIAVYSGSGRISITCNANQSSSDNYMVQSFPKTAWGKKYLTVPAAGNQAFNFYRVCVADPTTIVKINGVVTALPLQGNFYYEITQTNQPQLIESDKPITVAQYFTSQGACGNGNPGDPEVIYLSPVEQNISKVLWNATPNYLILAHYFNVVILNTGTAVSSFRLDGAVPAGAFTVHPQDPGYVYLRQSVSAGFHIIQSDSGFNSMAYGFGGAESYGYNGGTNIRDLFQFILIENEHGIIPFPATCRGTPFHFAMVFPYRPIQINWIFGAALNAMGINDTTIYNGGAPLIEDSSWVVAGRTVYRYRLPSTYYITAIGTYPIKVIATNPTPDGCGNEQIIDFDVQVFEPPIADFNFATNGCVTSPVSFTDNSNTGGRPIISRYWNFGDATTSNLAAPSHLYAAPATYNVRYTLITDVGCIADTVIHPVTLDNPPVADFTAAAPFCINVPVQFTDMSTASPGDTINVWAWTFGDGGTSTLQNPTHTYLTAGTFTVTLRVQTTNGCPSPIDTLIVTIAPDGTITLTSAPGTDNQTVCINTAIINITYAVGASGTGGSVSGLPAGVTGSFAGGIITITGTPTVSGVFNYTVTTTGPCVNPTATGTITVTQDGTVTLTSAIGTDNQTVCINTAIVNITYAVGGSGNGGSVSGLPAGVTGTFAGAVITITGTPTVSGVFNYTVNTTGPCVNPTATGTITVTADGTITLTSAPGTDNQTVCINTAIINITYAVGASGTGGSVSGLPAGVTGSFAGGIITITGTPTVSGTFNYTVNTTGPCVNPTATGTITVTADGTITLTSAPGTDNQTVCINTPIINITYAVGASGTGGSVSGLPAGVTGSFAGGIITITGTPTVSGTFNYTVTTTGPCVNPTATGTITVTPDGTITLTSAPGTNNQTVCINTPIINITYAIGGSGTGGSVSGLPAGVTGSFAGAVITISGTPTVSGTFNYTVTTTGPCVNPTATGTITVTPNGTITLTSGAGTDNQTVCINTPITNITYAVGGSGTGGSVSGLPAGVTGTFAGGVITISGTPTVSGTFNYTVTTTGPCVIPTATGTITVTPDGTITLTSAPGTNNQTVCINTPIINITYAIGGSGTGGSVSGLPAGVTGSFAGGVITITGIPSVSGVFNYTVSTTGPCVNPTATGTITVTQDGTITLTSAPGTNNQAVCLNSPITNITYAVAGSGTGGSVIGLPAGVTGNFAGGIITISGAPSVSGVFNYTVITTGPCVTPTATGTILVRPLPTANFSFTTPSCETRTISFTDLSVANAGSLTGWAWDFGDGGTSTAQNPTHTFATAGTYNVSLIVTTNFGCVSITPPQQVVINARPLAGYIVPEVCLSDTYAQFTDTSKVTAPDFISAWAWNFGDPGSGPLNTSTLQNPQHSYTATGLYTVVLVATSNRGCKDTVSHILQVNGSFPIADFIVQNPTTLCANDSVAIAEASSVFPGVITKVEIYWDNVGQPAVFDTDNFPVTGKIYKHLYPNFQAPLTRTFTIRYRAYSGGVCVNDKLRNITVNAAPLVQFNPMPNICYDAASYQITPAIAREIGGVPGSGIFTGPGVSLTGLFSPAVAGPGTHRIRYTFTSTTGGCIDTASNTITVWDTASAKIGVQPLLCEKNSISFNSTASTIPAGNGSIIGWTWNFGDPASGLANTSTSQNPSHLFTGWGNYNVTLIVTTSNGCRSTLRTLPVFVNPEPKPNFSTPASSCLPNASVSFGNLSTIADGTQASFSYLWNFGDPGSGANNTSTLANPSHIYTSTGPFTVNLQITSGAGCVHDTTINLNTVHPQPLASFTVDKIDVCIGSGIVFNNTSNPLDGTITQYNWTMDDGNAQSIPTFTYTYSTVGTYNISLFIFNSNGCRSTTYNKTVFVNPYPPVNAGPDKFMLEGGQVTLTPALNASMPVTYQWTPITWLSDPNIAYTIARPPDDITYTLRVTTDKGCSATDQVFIKVLKAPAIPNIFSPNGDGIHDTWVIQYLESYPGCTVDIFNRYGQHIYHSEGYSKPWDGTIKGNPVPIGTYYYIVNPKNGRKIMSGYVDVIR